MGPPEGPQKGPYLGPKIGLFGALFEAPFGQDLFRRGLVSSLIKGDLAHGPSRRAPKGGLNRAPNTPIWGPI